MTDTPPPIAYAVPIGNMGNIDVEHLRLLAIFHWIVGVIIFVLGSFPIIHIVIGALMLWTHLFPSNGPQDDAARHLAGWMFLAMGSIFVGIAWTIGILNICSGIWIKKRRRRLFSIVVGGIDCIVFPFGTVLGVFTLIVLLRRSVEMLYLSTARTHVTDGLEGIRNA